MTPLTRVGFREDVDHVPVAATALTDVARRLYLIRRLRDREFAATGFLFRDHAWDMLLDLFVAGEEGRAISACSAAIASCAPQTTGLRCLDDMVARGLVRRLDDPADGRRSVVEITADARATMLDILALTRDEWLR